MARHLRDFGRSYFGQYICDCTTFPDKPSPLLTFPLTLLLVFRITYCYISATFPPLLFSCLPLQVVTFIYTQVAFERAREHPGNGQFGASLGASLAGGCGGAHVMQRHANRSLNHCGFDTPRVKGA